MRKIIQNILVVTLALLMLIDIFPIGIRAGDDGPTDLGIRDDLGKDVETPTTPGYDTTKPGRLYPRANFDKAKPYLAGEGFYGDLSEKTFGQFDLTKKREEEKKNYGLDLAADPDEGSYKPGTQSNTLSYKWVRHKTKDGEMNYYTEILADGWTQEEMLQVTVAWMALWYDVVAKGGIALQVDERLTPNYGMNYPSPIPVFDVIAKVPVERETLKEIASKSPNGKYGYNFYYKVYFGFKGTGAIEFLNSGIPDDVYMKIYDFTSLVAAKNHKDNDKYIDIGATVPLNIMGVNLFKDYMDVVPRGTEFYLIDSSVAGSPQYNMITEDPSDSRNVPTITSRNYQVMQWGPRLVLKARSGKYENDDQFLFKDNATNTTVVKTVQDAVNQTEDVKKSFGTQTVDLLSSDDETVDLLTNDHSNDSNGTTDNIGIRGVTGFQYEGGELPSFKGKRLSSSLNYNINTADNSRVVEDVEYAATKFVLDAKKTQLGSFVGLFENVQSADTIGLNYDNLVKAWKRNGKKYVPLKKLLDMTEHGLQPPFNPTKDKDLQFVVPFHNGSVRGNYITRVQNKNTTDFIISKTRRDSSEFVNKKKLVNKDGRPVFDWNFNAYMFFVDEYDAPDKLSLVPPTIRHKSKKCRDCNNPQFRKENPEFCRVCQRTYDCSNEEYAKAHPEECRRYIPPKKPPVDRCDLCKTDAFYRQTHPDECRRCETEPGGNKPPNPNDTPPDCLKCSDVNFRKAHPRLCKICDSKPVVTACDLCEDPGYRAKNPDLCKRCDLNPDGGNPPNPNDTPPDGPKDDKVIKIVPDEKEIKPENPKKPGAEDTPIEVPTIPSYPEPPEIELPPGKTVVEVEVPKDGVTPKKPGADDTPILEPPVINIDNEGENKTVPSKPEGDKFKATTTIDLTGEPGDTKYVCVKMDGTKYINTKPTTGDNTKFCYKVTIGLPDIEGYKPEGTDIGIDPAEILIKGNKYDKENLEYEKGKPLSIKFNVKHFFGDKEVGLGTKENPRIKVQITAKDENNRDVMTKNMTLNRSIKHGEIGYLDEFKVTPNTDSLRVCARIDDELAKLKLNVKNANDYVCMTLGKSDNTKNYSVRDVILGNLGVDMTNNQKTWQPKEVKIPIFFKVTNDSKRGEKTELPSDVNYSIYVDGRRVKTDTVRVAPGTSKGVSIRDVKTTIYPNWNKSKPIPVTVVVNERRNPQEFIEGVNDPYKDNSKTANLYVYETDRGCPRTAYREHLENRNNEASVQYQVNYTYLYDIVLMKREWGRNYWGDLRPFDTEDSVVEPNAEGKASATFTKEVKFDENIGRSTGLFRSKYTYDQAGTPINQRNERSDNGWVRPSLSKIKNGNGFEFKYNFDYSIRTSNGRSLKDQVNKYEAMRYAEYPRTVSLPEKYAEYNRESWKNRPRPYDGMIEYFYEAVSKERSSYWDDLSQYLTYDSHKSMDKISDLVSVEPGVYIRMPIMQGSGNKQVCIKLDEFTKNENETSSSYKKVTEFRLPENKSITDKETVRKIFTRRSLPYGDEALDYSIYPSEIVGLKYNQYTDKKLRAGGQGGRFFIMKNDDLKTHLVN